MRKIGTSEPAICANFGTHSVRPSTSVQNELLCSYRLTRWANADTADVNGDNSVEFDELEMVIIAMDHSHGLSHEDMLYQEG